jgi:hypothetical protein
MAAFAKTWRREQPRRATRAVRENGRYGMSLTAV